MTVGSLEATQERPPYIKFERRAIEDKPASLRAGHVVMKDVDYAIVSPSGSRDSVNLTVQRYFEYEAQNVQNNRTPLEWLERWKNGYELWKKGEEVPVDGTPIKGWGALSPAQQQNVIACKILTVEDLAQATDEGFRRLGMGGRDLVNKAKAWLSAANDTGKIALQNAALEKANEQLQTTVDSLEEKLEILTRQVQAQAGQNQAPQIVTSEDLCNEPSETYFSDTATLGDHNLSLSERYELKFGKKPHHLMKEATMRKRLEE